MMPAPFLELHFAVSIPAVGDGCVEAVPLLEETCEMNSERVESLRMHLEQPYSALRLRIKQLLEKAIASEVTDLVPAPALALQETGIRPHPAPMIHSIIGLNEVPRSTGRAYIMKGRTPADAPFVGFTHQSSCAKDIKLGAVQMPALYQPYCDAGLQPHCWVPPSTTRPTGELKYQLDAGRTFNLVRH